MSLTPNFGFNIPESTDIVNLLTQCYPNFTIADTAMQAIKAQGISQATESKSGTVHNIVRVDSDCSVFWFTATSNFATGDTFTVDGSPVSAVKVSGAGLETGDFVINSNVPCIVKGGVLTVLAGGGSSTVLAEDVTYDNTVSGLTATDVQDAIDELKADMPVVPATYDADNVTYDNTGSGLTATNAQDAIDELATLVNPGYSSDGLRTGAGITITSGGYYVLNGYCHVDITITSSTAQSSGANVIEQLPPASSGTGYITPVMNNMAVHYNSGASQSTLSVYANFGVNTLRFIGSYPTTVTP